MDDIIDYLHFQNSSAGCEEKLDSALKLCTPENSCESEISFVLEATILSNDAKLLHKILQSRIGSIIDSSDDIIVRIINHSIAHPSEKRREIFLNLILAHRVRIIPAFSDENISFERVVRNWPVFKLLFPRIRMFPDIRRNLRKTTGSLLHVAHSCTARIDIDTEVRYYHQLRDAVLQSLNPDSDIIPEFPRQPRNTALRNKTDVLPIIALLIQGFDPDELDNGKDPEEEEGISDEDKEEIDTDEEASDFESEDEDQDLEAMQVEEELVELPVTTNCRRRPFERMNERWPAKCRLFLLHASFLFGMRFVNLAKCRTFHYLLRRAKHNISLPSTPLSLSSRKQKCDALLDYHTNSFRQQFEYRCVRSISSTSASSSTFSSSVSSFSSSPILVPVAPRSLYNMCLMRVRNLVISQNFRCLTESPNHTSSSLLSNAIECLPIPEIVKSHLIIPPDLERLCEWHFPDNASDSIGLSSNRMVSELRSLSF